MTAVDIEKLSRGLNTVFKGIAIIFDSLGEKVDELDDLAEKMNKETTKAAVKHTAQEEPEKAETANSDKESEAQSSRSVEEAEKTEVPTNPEKEKSAPQVTVDDITKIIVQKIKKDRSNNEKIGQILKTYGVAKVGELPPSKYEAFLTELAGL